MTKLSSSLPKDYEDDGLGSINRELVDRPTETQLVVMMIDCKSVTRDIDTGLEVATARILSIEPLHDEGRIEQAREMLLQAKDRRVGKKALPGIEVVNGKTGEIFDLKTSTGYWPAERVYGGGDDE